MSPPERVNTRKRLRNDTMHKRYLKKECVEKGLEYVTKSGKTVAAKRFHLQHSCKCSKKCSVNIDVLRQKELFDNYYKLLSWNQKTLFLRSCVKLSKPERQKAKMLPLMPLKYKEFTYKYMFLDAAGVSHFVCKHFFCTCLQVTPSRMQRAIKLQNANPAAVDHRGVSAPANKTKPNDYVFLKKFIEKFPKYRSHYRRDDTQRHYLAPNLNLTKMYGLYQVYAEFKGQRPISLYVFRHVFYTQFNLAFKKPKSDTCKECDEIACSLDSLVVTNAAKRKLEDRKAIHLTNVESTCREFKDDVLKARGSGGETQCLTFDLQKTLEVPSITTSVAYYKRQLWVYNLCVYDESTNQAHMYVWNESVASRGAQEISSCLLDHIANHVADNCKELILWSDSCPGQNKNIKITMMLKKILNDRRSDMKYIVQ